MRTYPSTMTRIHEPARDDRRRPRDRRARRRQRAGRSGGGARRGARRRRTTLVDRYGCFGGNITQVGVESIAWYRHEQTVEGDGIGRELEERAEAMGAAEPESQSLSQGINAERFKFVADVLVAGGRHHADAAPARRRSRSSRAGRSAGSSPRASPGARRSSRSGSSTRPATPTSRHGPGAPVRKTPREEMLAASVMFSMTGVDKAASSTRSRPIPRPTATGPAMPSGTSRRPARRTTSSRRSSASRSSRPSRQGSSRPTS